MKEQYGPIFAPAVRRAHATDEDLQARQARAQQMGPPVGTSTRSRHPVQRLTEDSPLANRHRVGHTPGLHPEDAPSDSQEEWPSSYQPVAADEELDSPDYSPRRRTTVVVRPAAKPTRRLPRTRFHPLVFVGTGLLLMLAGWLALSALSSWWGVQLDDWHYGRPRTYQTDAVVGHGDSAAHPSHFIAVNLNGQVLVIELPGGDPSKAHLYRGPRLFGAGEDLAPVTVSFEDCNGDGKPDLNLHIEGSDKIICFVNNGKTFTTTQPQ